MTMINIDTSGKKLVYKIFERVEKEETVRLECEVL